MSSLQITAKHLAIRLGTVTRDLDRKPEEIPLFASIAGVRIPLTIDSFQVDDDGTLLFLKGFDGFLDALRTEMKEMEQCLINESQRYNALWLQFDNLQASCRMLVSEMGVMCEAQLAGDRDLVQRKVEQFTQNYLKNCKPAGANGSVH